MFNNKLSVSKQLININDFIYFNSDCQRLQTYSFGVPANKSISCLFTHCEILEVMGLFAALIATIKTWASHSHTPIWRTHAGVQFACWG